ncbi:MAG: adenylate/guanylate cyclase domain-containing protein [Desulfobacteraceae bacterium]
MDNGSYKRRLAALISADVVGYSRLMADDDIATIRALTACRDTIGRLIEADGGRLVDFVGDNLLAEFPNTQDAVSCAERIHHKLEEFNSHLPEHRHIILRIGVHMGEVTADGDRLYGNGVNIAARLESLADPGGICISDAVFGQIRWRSDLQFVEMGLRDLKNIPEPVRTYQLVTATTLINKQSEQARPAAYPDSLPLPAKPSLAVLPFVNLDMTEDQDHFSDGLTMDIITALVQIPSLFLISDITAFNIKSTPMSIADIGRRLGVQYLLEGGVRSSGDRLRITTRLSEADSGRQIWAQRFDREWGDIFDIQDEITSEIVMAMDIKLVSGEPGRVVRQAVKNLQALEYYYRGWSAMFSASPDYIRQAQQMFDEMIRLEPESFLGYAVGAWAYCWGLFNNASDDRERDLAQVKCLARKARELGDHTGMADLAMAHLHLMNKDPDKALTAAERAVITRPSCDISYAVKASILTYLGRPEEAAPLARMAMRLSPVYPSYYPTVLGFAHYHSGQMQQALEAAEISIKADPASLEAMILLAAIYDEMGADEKARRMAEQISEHHPGFSLDDFSSSHPYQDPKQLQRILNSVAKVISAISP